MLNRSFRPILFLASNTLFRSARPTLAPLPLIFTKLNSSQAKPMNKEKPKDLNSSAAKPLEEGEKDIFNLSRRKEGAQEKNKKEESGKKSKEKKQLFETKEHPDGLKFLFCEHTKLRALFTDIQSTTDWEVKSKLMRDIISEVARHSSAEERYLYPLITDKIPESNMLHERILLDNHINKEILAFLDKNNPKTPEERVLYEITINKFIMIELEHMQQLEEIVLKDLAERMTDKEKEELETNLRWAIGNAPTHPHPSVPTVAANILHPLAGMVDKITDEAEKLTELKPQQN